MNQIKNTKKLIGTGIAGMAGLGALGIISNTPGMPSEAKSVVPLASAGVTIGMAGQLVNMSKDVMPKTKTRKSSGDKRLDKMLGW